MRSTLPALARELGADDRTLRRAAARGTLHCRRPGPRRLELTDAERAYLSAHWDLLARLTETLLMADVVEDGRVLIDRDGTWAAWRERGPALQAEADRTQSQAEDRARAVFAYYANARWEAAPETNVAAPVHATAGARILQVIDMVPLQHRGLTRALERFGGTDGFDVEAYVAARASDDLDLFDRTAPAERYWSVLQNLLLDLADLGLAEARRVGVNEARRAGRTFQGLADLGVLAQRDAVRLTEMQDIRNDDQHMYPAEVRRLARAMLDLDALVPTFMTAYGRWFESWPREPR